MPLLLLLSILVVFATCMSGFDIRQHFGTKTRYDLRGRVNQVLLQNSKDAVGCKPIFVYGVVRHGTRYPTSKRMQEMKNNQHIIKDLFGARGVVQLEEEMAGELHDIGEMEMFQLGQRLAQRFPNIFNHPHSNKSHKMHSSQKSRALSSAMAFSMGAWPQRRSNETLSFPQPVAITMNPKNNDPLLRFFDLCPNYWKTKKQTEKTSMGWMKRYYQEILVSNKKLQKFEVNEDQLQSLWKQCVNEGSISNNQTGVCSLFEEKHVRVLEWLDDLILFQTKGPAQPVNIGMARPLVQDLIQLLQELQGQSKEEVQVEKSRLYFAHAETLVPFETLLGIIGQDEMGSFNGNFIAPYGANLFAIVYDCADKGGLRVQLYQNEERIGCRGGKGGSCLVSDFIQQLQNNLKGYEPFNKLCGVEEQQECKVEL